jgi:hypothetical protein
MPGGALRGVVVDEEDMEVGKEVDMEVGQEEGEVFRWMEAEVEVSVVVVV